MMNQGCRINLAATRTDWVNLFAGLNDELLFYPVSAASLEEMRPCRIGEIPGLGTAKTGVLILEDAFLVIPAAQSLVPRKIIQNNGSVGHAADQTTNKESFIFRPGGVCENGFVIGEISSLYSAGACAEAARTIKTQMRRKAYQNRGDYKIAPDCFRLYSDLFFATDCRNGHTKKQGA